MDGNRLHGQAMALESKDTLIWSDGMPVGVIGLDDIVVIAANGAVLVAAKSHVQKVKAVAAEFAARAARSNAEASKGATG